MPRIVQGVKAVMKITVQETYDQVTRERLALQALPHKSLYSKQDYKSSGTQNNLLDQRTYHDIMIHESVYTTIDRGW